MILHYYRLISERLEYCFNVEVIDPLSSREEVALFWLLSETFDRENFNLVPHFGAEAVEFGPRLNFATPFNTNALSILRNCGLEKVKRLERSRRVVVEKNLPLESYYDRMTECIYPEPIESFDSGLRPEEVYELPLKEKGLALFSEIDDFKSMDEADKQFYYNYFVKKCGRNPTIVEMMDLNNANSEHSRHGYFKGRQVIDGVLMPETLMEIVKSTLKAGPGDNSLLAFCDNSSAILGTKIKTLVPKKPGHFSALEIKEALYHLLFTAETHNFPSGIAPFPGAETGTGGRIRDVQATGRGGLVVAGTAGYCVGNLLIPGYDLPWEKKFTYPSKLAPPLEILIQASNGASDYGNKFGEPVIQGFVRTGALLLPNGERREWLKPIMFTGGIGQLENGHIKKDEAQVGMLIIQIGGPAYRIGFGGGAASSLNQGDNKSDLDFNAVQRGDAEMEQKMNRVVRACVEMGEKNPIVSIHDQGAGGPANVLKELVEKNGGVIDIGRITLGDPTMSVLEVWVCEYQERNGLLIRSEHLEDFQVICERERVNCEVLGTVSNDGRFVAMQKGNWTKPPVDLHLEKVLGGLPQKTFVDERQESQLKPLSLPEDLSLFEALNMVLRLPSVGSKRFLTNKVDRSVTGLIAQQQCVGPLQLPLADYALVAQSHFLNQEGKYSGGAIAIGEQPIKMLLDPEAGARMTVAEAFTNLIFSGVGDMSKVKCSGNWMWAPKLPGEGAKLYDAACAMRDLMLHLGWAIDGGKDSLSMATKVLEKDNSSQMVKSPGELVISAYALVEDISLGVTPDIKHPGESDLYWIDLALGQRRLGGSALAQVFEQIGNDCPDVMDPEMMLRAALAVKAMLDSKTIIAGHDISDGGVMVAVLEMLFAGNCGAKINLSFSESDTWENLFAEEVGLIVEVDKNKQEHFSALMSYYQLSWMKLAETTKEKMVVISNEWRELIMEADMQVLRDIWEHSSYELEKLQANPVCVEEEKYNIFSRLGASYHLSFTPEKSSPDWIYSDFRPKVAILREEGSNGDREMTSAFHEAGFEVYDIHMSDLLTGKTNLLDYRGVAFVGGFSYADVLDSAKGWAGVIRFNPQLKEMFKAFYEKSDTFSLGVCNGCQLSALLGWVPMTGLADEIQPRFIKNKSGRFESRFSTVKILPSPAIMFKGMADSILGIWSAHGEGRFHCKDKTIINMINENHLAPVRYVDDLRQISESYPFNPNGSPDGIAALCDSSGRHLAIMPHPERTFLKWQWAYMPEDWKQNLVASPWLKMFQNAREWCL